MQRTISPSKLLAHDESLEVQAQIYAGDKAYDDTDLHYRLWQQGKHSALRLRRFRTGKKDGNKEVWQELEKTPEYEAGLMERYKIERKFGQAKRWHGLGRCRYLGLLRYGVQAFLTILALNLKRIIQLLTGVFFRPPSRKRVRVAREPGSFGVPGKGPEAAKQNKKSAKKDLGSGEKAQAQESGAKIGRKSDEPSLIGLLFNVLGRIES